MENTGPSGILPGRDTDRRSSWDAVRTVDHARTVAGSSDPYLRRMERLLEVVRELSHARSLERVTATVRSSAPQLTGADGATFVLRDGDLCYDADEDAIEPLWKGLASRSRA